MCSVSSLCDTTRPRWCIRYERTRNSWLVSFTGVPSTRDAGEPRIERDRAAAELRRAPGRSTRRMSAAQPREHFLHPERLGDVVVGAAVDALHLLVPAAARGQDQHRASRGRRRASARSTRQAVDPRQPEVEDHRVVAVRSARENRRARRRRRSRPRSRPAGSALGQLLATARFVFDDQHPHVDGTSVLVIAQARLNAT